MNTKELYEGFHRNTKAQVRLIDDKNFTYRNLFKILKLLNIDVTRRSILDYGCGAGTMSLYLASKGHQVTGFDVSNKAIVSCQKSAINLKLQKHTFFTTNESEIQGKFNLCICIEVIEHLPNDSAKLKFIANKLKRGGFAIISTPSKNAPLFRMGLTKEFDQKVGHLRRYDSDNLSQMIERCGFKVLEVRKTEGIIRNAMFLIKPFTKLVRFTRGYISDLVAWIDELTIPILGESNLYIICQRV